MLVLLGSSSPLCHGAWWDRSVPHIGRVFSLTYICFTVTRVACICLEQEGGVHCVSGFKVKRRIKWPTKHKHAASIHYSRVVISGRGRSPGGKRPVPFTNISLSTQRNIIVTTTTNNYHKHLVFLYSSPLFAVWSSSLVLYWSHWSPCHPKSDQIEIKKVIQAVQNGVTLFSNFRSGLKCIFPVLPKRF